MAEITMPTFNEYFTEEQHQRTIRKLKLAKHKREFGQRNKDDIHSAFVSPSIPLTNKDNIDSDTNIPYGMHRKHDNEVSSSYNPNNVLAKNPYQKSNIKSIATSSITNCNKKSVSENDYFLTPLSSDSRSAFKKLSSTVTSNNINVPIWQNESSNINKDSFKKTSASLSGSSLFSSTIVCNKKPTNFVKWKVVLNEKCQLIIRGTIETGEIARSKPLARRLTSKTVESVSKHLYNLQGDIADDKHELPDYVRGKFYSGFPEDWQNVYEVWRTFVRQGSKITFRWPTKVADSDDDLKSEVADLTYISDSAEDETLHCSTFIETRVPRKSVNPELTFNVLEPHTPRREVRDSLSQTCEPDTKRNSNRSVAVQTPTQECSHNKENYESERNLLSSCPYIKRRKDKLKAKVNVLIDTLADTNCSHQCINNIVKIVDWIKYVASHGSTNDVEFCTKNSQAVEDKCTVQGESNESITLLNATECDRNKYDDTRVNHKDFYILEPSGKVDNHATDCNNSLQKKKSVTEIIKRESDYSTDSEDETYSGIPKISPNIILQQRRDFVKPCKRKTTKYQYSGLAVTDSTAAGIDTTEKHKEKNTEKTNESPRRMNETVDLLQKESSSKKSVATETMNSVSSVNFDNGNDYGPTFSEADSTNPRKLMEDSTAIVENNRNKDDSKPMLLSGWVPRVTNKPELGLIFEGTLLNATGHVVCRKFKTSVVSRRISQKLIETVNQELYELIGDLNDTKHVVPKKLLSACRYGCPSKIQQFCKAWKNENDENVSFTTKESNDTIIDSANVRVSSKGRRIVPPLNYWTGERITLKNNNLVYTPGNSQLLSSNSLHESLNRSKHLNKSRKQQIDEIKENNPKELQDKNMDSTEKLANREWTPKNKKRPVVRVESSGSDDDKVIPAIKKRKVLNNSGDVTNKGGRGTELKLYTRENTEPIVSRLGIDKQMCMTHKLQTGDNVVDVMFTRGKAPFKDLPLLSDDQESCI